jgi:hypothetical protein
MTDGETQNISVGVLVVGGGVAGTAAALASARSGIPTALVEREDFLGGAGYAGLLRQICGLYLNGGPFPQETLNPGIVREIVGNLHALSPNLVVKKMGMVYILPYSREDLRNVFGSLCTGESLLSVYNVTTAVAIEKTGTHISKVVVSRSGMFYTIIPKVVIDCSGSGALAAMAGASFESTPYEEMQLAGYTIRIIGIKGDDEALAIKVPYNLNEAVRKNILPPAARFTTYSPGDVPDEGYCKISLDSTGGDERERDAVMYSTLVHKYLADALPEFRDSAIVESSLCIMEREGRRILGEYILTENDVLSASKFDDGIVKNSWPIELWDKKKGTVYRYVKAGDYYEIPFRCIKVRDVPNLLCAGRCISVSHEALGSTRVMGTCMALGEQAGLAAAFMVKQGRCPERVNGKYR